MVDNLISNLLTNFLALMTFNHCRHHHHWSQNGRSRHRRHDHCQRYLLNNPGLDLRGIAPRRSLGWVLDLQGFQNLEVGPTF
jgi:hypothetical protein